MKKLLFVATLLATVSLAGAAQAQHRLRDSAVGVIGGAVVAGPVGAVAGGVIGYTAGPRISRAISPHHHYVHHRRTYVRRKH